MDRARPGFAAGGERVDLALRRVARGGLRRRAAVEGVGLVVDDGGEPSPSASRSILPRTTVPPRPRTNGTSARGVARELGAQVRARASRRPAGARARALRHRAPSPSRASSRSSSSSPGSRQPHWALHSSAAWTALPIPSAMPADGAGLRHLRRDLRRLLGGLARRRPRAPRARRARARRRSDIRTARREPAPSRRGGRPGRGAGPSASSGRPSGGPRTGRPPPAAGSCGRARRPAARPARSVRISRRVVGGTGSLTVHRAAAPAARRSASSPAKPRSASAGSSRRSGVSFGLCSSAASSVGGLVDAREDQAVARPRGGDVDEAAALLGLGLARRAVEVDELPQPHVPASRERKAHAEPARSRRRSAGRS